ncbi:MAG: type II secretion system protein GspK [Verrucomicrobia bacterium]|nr:type II secretion system protein GspK [Verrucomicrobiota bacterium]
MVLQTLSQKMRTRAILGRPKLQMDLRTGSRASVLVVVLWITAGLTALVLYFAASMSLELRASANRAADLAAGQAIEGAARYVGWALAQFATNGMMTTNSQFVCQALPIGESQVWILGRNPAPAESGLNQLVFNLQDESGRLNLNRANSNALSMLPGMTTELAAAIVDWRSTNGTLQLGYSSLGYEAKRSPFETVDELRWVQGITLDHLFGDDRNQNGILDPDERSLTGSLYSTPGLLDTTTVFSREPNFHADGTLLTNVNTQAQIQGLLESSFGTGRSREILTRLGFTQGGGPGGGGGGGGAAAATPNFPSLLRFYLTSGLSQDDFERIAPELCVTTNTYSYGRVNLNTANATVLTALFVGAGLAQEAAEGAASTLVRYREQNTTSLNSIAWMVAALGRDHQAVTTLAGRDLLTTRSFQYGADLVAVGPLGRGYRRVKFIFDISDGVPKILYRQDLSRLGWALGDRVREQIAQQIDR